MDNTTGKKIMFEESYTLYNISYDSASQLIKEKLPEFRDLWITISDDSGDLIITFYTEEEDQRHFNRSLKLFKKNFQPYIMTPPNTSLESVFFQLMSERKFHVSTAESCTGGMLSSRIINVSGSSSIIEEAFITYSENAKMKVLGVNQNTLKKYGVVSEEVAGEMAKCLKKLTECDLSLSITGIAGPLGGSDAVPVGTVCLGIAFQEQTVTYKKWFPGDRASVRKKAVSFALAESILLLKNVIKTK